MEKFSQISTEVLPLIYVKNGFDSPPLKKCRYFVISSFQKFALCLCLSVTTLDSALYLEHFLADFLQILHNN